MFHQMDYVMVSSSPNIESPSVCESFTETNWGYPSKIFSPGLNEFQTEGTTLALQRAELVNRRRKQQLTVSDSTCESGPDLRRTDLKGSPIRRAPKVRDAKGSKTRSLCGSGWSADFLRRIGSGND